MGYSVKLFILSDYYRYWGGIAPFYIICLKALCCVNHAFSFQFWFRLAKGASNCIIVFFAHKMYLYYCRKFQIYMPLSVELGYGLYMGHCMCMVIAEGTKIGNNCNLSQFLNIGSNHGSPAMIGNNVYVGPHVCLVDDVQIGDNVTIGAGAVVTKNLPDNATAVGVPAKIITYENAGKYIVNKWGIK